MSQNSPQKITKSTLTFITESLPTFFVGVPTHFAVQAVGGTAPYTFKVTQGNLSPLTLSSDGVIKGTPSAASNGTVEITVTDSANPPASLTQAFAYEVAQQ
jgi:hypothetical protein